MQKPKVELKIDRFLEFWVVFTVSFFHENFAEQLVILLNCPKGREGTYHPPVGVMLVKRR